MKSAQKYETDLTLVHVIYLTFYVLSVPFKPSDLAVDFLHIDLSFKKKGSNPACRDR